MGSAVDSVLSNGDRIFFAFPVSFSGGSVSHAAITSARGFPCKPCHTSHSTLFFPPEQLTSSSSSSSFMFSHRLVMVLLRSRRAGSRVLKDSSAGTGSSSSSRLATTARLSVLRSLVEDIRRRNASPYLLRWPFRPEGAGGCCC